MRAIILKIQEIPGGKSNGTEIISMTFISSVYLARLSSFPEIFENAVTFATGQFVSGNIEILGKTKRTIPASGPVIKCIMSHSLSLLIVTVATIF